MPISTYQISLVLEAVEWDGDKSCSVFCVALRGREAIAPARFTPAHHRDYITLRSLISLARIARQAHATGITESYHISLNDAMETIHFITRRAKLSGDCWGSSGASSFVSSTDSLTTSRHGSALLTEGD
jgi:hypothetical protein